MTTTHATGKIAFTSPDHALQVQAELINLGFSFTDGSPHPRPSAYGVMWQHDSNLGTKTLRTAANRQCFKYYAPIERESIYIPERVPSVPGAKKTPREQGLIAALAAKEKSQQRKKDLTGIAWDALYQIGEHEKNLYGTNSRSQARLKAWEVYVNKCLELNGHRPKAHSLRKAIMAVMDVREKPYLMPDDRRFYKLVREFVYV